MGRNEIHVCMTQFLDAAKDLHTATCLFDPEHRAQSFLFDALDSVLIGAQECSRGLRRLQFKDEVDV